MNPDPTIAWGVVVALTVMIGLAVNLATLARVGKTQKREVTFGEEFAPRGETARRLDKIESEVREVNQQRRSDVQAIHHELTGVRESVASVESETRSLGSQMETISTAVVEINRQMGVLIGRSEKK